MEKDEELLTKLINNEDKLDKAKDDFNHFKRLFDEETINNSIVSLIAVVGSIILGFIATWLGLHFIVGPILTVAIALGTIVDGEFDIGMSLLLSPLILLIDLITISMYFIKKGKIKSYERKNKKIENKINEYEEIEKKKKKEEELIEKQKLKEKEETIDHAVIEELITLQKEANKIEKDKYRDYYTSKIKKLSEEYNAKLIELLYEQVIKTNEIKLSNSSISSLDSEYLKECGKIGFEISKIQEIEAEIKDIEEERSLLTDLSNKKEISLSLKK